MDFGFTAFVMGVAIVFAVGGSLVLVGYVGTLPASFSFGWQQWLPVLLVPFLGPLWFARRHHPEFRRPFFQLASGVLLVLVAGLMLYLGGPMMIDRMATGGR